MEGTIYKVTSPSGKIYIGKTTKKLEIRKKQHFVTAKLGSDTKFSNAIRKYGELLIWEIIDNSDNKDNLSLLEISWIKYYNSYKSGYNSTLGGDGSSKYDNIEDAIKARNDTFKKYYTDNSKIIYQRKL